MGHTRREFLARMSCALLGQSAFAVAAEKFLAVNSLAEAGASGADDYRALVCIFLFGGNDANNMVIPRTEYDLYGSQPRARGGTAIQIPFDDLLPINPPSDPGGREYGLHPALGDPAGGWPTLYDLWAQQKLAIVVNVGTLVRPITREEYFKNPNLRPYLLFDHSNQQRQWQTASASVRFRTGSQTGWGGRLADLLEDELSRVPTVISLSTLGAPIFGIGRQTRELQIPPAPTPLSQSLQLARPSDAAEGSALRRLLQADRSESSPVLVRNAARVTDRAIQNSLLLQARDPDVGEFPNTPLGNQLKQIAKFIALSQDLSITRQVFFASLGGFDTHANQGGVTGLQANLFSQVSQAMATFYDALGDLEGRDLRSQVTTFTKSEFSRAFSPGVPGTGTEHAWGGHHFVLGGAVRGGDFYGRFPRLVLDGPDDSDRGPNARGIWIPTTSVDQYGATLASWFGVSKKDLVTVFPNIEAFPTPDLGFMQAVGKRLG